MAPVQFDTIPSGVRVPFVAVEFTTTRAQQGPSVQPINGLVIAQKTSAGGVAALTPFLATSVEQVRAAAGPGSMAHGMALSLFRNNLTVAWTFVLLDDAAASVAATKTITITGTQTAAGTIYLYVAGRRYEIGVALADTNNAIAAAIAAKIATIDDVPVTGGAATNVCTLTARNKGTMGTKIDVRLNYHLGEQLPPGLVVTIADAVAGATDPALTLVWPVLDPNVQYNVMAVGLNNSANLAATALQLEQQAGPLINLQSEAFFALDDTHSGSITISGALNSRYLSIMPADNSPSPTWEWAAAYAAQVGGSIKIDPSLHMKTLELVGILAPTASDPFSFTERDALLNNGLSTFTVDIGSGIVRIERSITTFRLTPSGAQTVAYLDVTVVFTLDFIRYDIRNQTLLKYPRHKIANDLPKGAPAGQPIVTPSVYKLFLIGLANGWLSLGYIEDIEQFKRDLIVERNLADPTRMDVVMAPNLVNPFLILGVQVQFLL